MSGRLSRKKAVSQSSVNAHDNTEIYTQQEKHMHVAGTPTRPSTRERRVQETVFHSTPSSSQQHYLENEITWAEAVSPLVNRWKVKPNLIPKRDQSLDENSPPFLRMPRVLDLKTPPVKRMKSREGSPVSTKAGDPKPFDIIEKLVATLKHDQRPSVSDGKSPQRESPSPPIRTNEVSLNNSEDFLLSQALDEVESRLRPVSPVLSQKSSTPKPGPRRLLRIRSKISPSQRKSQDFSKPEKRFACLRSDSFQEVADSVVKPLKLICGPKCLDETPDVCLQTELQLIHNEPKKTTSSSVQEQKSVSSSLYKPGHDLLENGENVQNSGRPATTKPVIQSFSFKHQSTSINTSAARSEPVPASKCFIFPKKPNPCEERSHTSSRSSTVLVQHGAALVKPSACAAPPVMCRGNSVHSNGLSTSAYGLGDQKSILSKQQRQNSAAATSMIRAVNQEAAERYSESAVTKPNNSAKTQSVDVKSKVPVYTVLDPAGPSQKTISSFKFSRPAAVSRPADVSAKPPEPSDLSNAKSSKVQSPRQSNWKRWSSMPLESPSRSKSNILNDFDDDDEFESLISGMKDDSELQTSFSQPAASIRPGSAVDDSFTDEEFDLELLQAVENAEAQHRRSIP